MNLKTLRHYLLLPVQVALKSTKLRIFATHKGMNTSAIEFMSVLDDVLATLDKSIVGQRDQEEVVFILYSMRNEVFFR